MTNPSLSRNSSVASTFRGESALFLNLSFHAYLDQVEFDSVIFVVNSTTSTSPESRRAAEAWGEEAEDCRTPGLPPEVSPTPGADTSVTTRALLLFLCASATMAWYLSRVSAGN